MKGIKDIIIKVTVGIALFSAGIAVGVPACWAYDRAAAAAETPVSASVGTAGSEEDMNDGGAENELMLRMRDGNLEWYDGVRWNHAGTVEELAAADPIAQPSAEWQALVARLAEARAGEQAGEPAALSRDSGSLSVDEITAGRPQSPTPAVTRPTTSGAGQPAAPAQTGNGNSSSNNSNNNNGNNNSNNDNDSSDNNDNDGGHDEGPAPAPEPVPEPEPEPEPEPGDTGDGENIEWSGDYE